MLAVEAQLRVGKLTVQGLAMMAWSFATAGESDEKLFTVLARALAQGMSKSKPQSLANAVWAFATAGATAGIWDEKLFAALAKVAKLQVGKFKQQGCANTA